MSTTTLSPVDDQQIGRWLAAARDTIANVRYCWLATRAQEGGAHARAVRVFAGAAGSEEWTRRFVCRRNSRKIGEIRADPRVTLAFQTDSGDAYVALGGSAELVEDKTEIRDLWPANVNTFFPEGFADTNMIVVRVPVDRIEVHVRGVTAEPFGHGRTLIERAATGQWRFIPY